MMSGSPNVSKETNKKIYLWVEEPFKKLMEGDANKLSEKIHLSVA